MSHSVYQTPAIVLRVKNMRESNKLAVLYTRDFGLVYVGAQSIREARSKMKPHLQSLSMVDVDLVRGREVWRLTGIHENLASLNFVQKLWYPLLDRISSTIQRLCQGEEPHIELWQELDTLYQSVREEEVFDETIEVVALCRILNSLGYWSADVLSVTTKDPYGKESLLFARENNMLLIKNINKGLIDSQL